MSEKQLRALLAVLFSRSPVFSVSADTVTEESPNRRSYSLSNTRPLRLREREQSCTF